jgi:hypothetical protein
MRHTGKRTLAQIRCLVVFALVATFAVTATAAGIRLYLKDGSYHLVKSYEIQGDRVRFYSVERSEWEEVPVSIVDFEATKRGEADEKAAQQKQLEDLRKLDTQRFEPAATTGYEIAPGMHLPTGEGIYAFDGERVVTLIQSAGEIVKDKKRFALSMALPAPLLKNRDLVILDGPKAAVRIRATKPAFYVQFQDLKASDVQLIPVTAKKEIRILEKIQSGIGVGKSGEVREAIPVERTEVKPGLILLHPVAPLAAGEYALAELVSQKLNLEVWDFGIDPR